MGKTMSGTCARRYRPPRRAEAARAVARLAHASRYKESVEIDWIDFKKLKPLFDKRNYSSKIVIKENVIKLVISKCNQEHSIGCEQEYLIGHTDKDIDFKIGFNASLLDRAIGKNTSKLVFKFNNECSPCEVNGAIVMPLRL